MLNAPCRSLLEIGAMALPRVSDDPDEPPMLSQRDG
jgi:hypothetical protein